jgi:hypothetical protein
MTNDHDPGWRPSLRALGWTAIPVVGLFMRAKARGRETNWLILLRTIFLALVPALFLFPVALSFIEPWDGGDERWVPRAVLLSGIVSVVWVLGIRRRQLPTSSPEALAGSYRALLFIGIAAAEVPVFAGITGVLLRGSLWIYLVGLPFALVGLWMVAPSKSDIERRQREITASGSPLSLLAALISGPPSKR